MRSGPSARAMPNVANSCCTEALERRRRIDVRRTSSMTSSWPDDTTRLRSRSSSVAGRPVAAARLSTSSCSCTGATGVLTSGTVHLYDESRCET